MRLWIFFAGLIQIIAAAECGKDKYVYDIYPEIANGICSAKNDGICEGKCERIETIEDCKSAVATNNIEPVTVVPVQNYEVSGEHITITSGICPAGTRIETRADCETYAANGGYKFDFETEINNRPGGCYTMQDGSIRHNDHYNDRECSSDYKCICNKVHGICHYYTNLGDRGAFDNVVLESSCDDLPSYGKKCYCLKPDGGCANCPNGWINKLEGASYCTACEAGMRQVEGENSRTCVACESGTYQQEAGSTICYTCPWGWNQQETGQTDCIKCLAGKYDASDQCKVCLPGTYQEEEGAQECKKCLSGQYQEEEGQWDCDDCKPGKYQTDLKQTVCDTCNVGYYQDETASSTCKKCPINEYQDERGEKNCQQCEPGKTTTGTGNTQCIPCADTNCNQCNGFGVTGGNTCDKCTIGKYSLNTRECQICPNGWTSEQTSSSCIECTNRYYPDNILGRCDLCPIAKINPQNSDLCEFCLPGQYVNMANEQIECSTCPIGFYKEDITQPHCTGCSPGYYQPLAGQTECLMCKFPLKSGWSMDDCTHPCPETFDVDHWGQKECKYCETLGEEEFANHESSEILENDKYVSIGSGNCQTGYEILSHDECKTVLTDLRGSGTSFALSNGQSDMNINRNSGDRPSGCTREGFKIYWNDNPDGQPCSDSWRCICKNIKDPGCKKCPLGKFQSHNWFKCSFCPPGKTPSSDSTSCDVCGSGQYGANGICISCPKGKFFLQTADGTPPITCNDCEIGNFQDIEGQTTCKKCLSGQYSDEKSKTICTNCPKGYNSEPESVGCLKCPDGMTTDAAGENDCKYCPVPKFEKDGLCQSCPKGWTFGRSDAANCGASPNFIYGPTCLSKCEACPEGKYQDKSDVAYATTCQTCPQGYYGDLSGSDECKTCPNGYLTNSYESGSTFCVSCGATDDNCQECAAGKYFKKNDDATSTCAECPNGYISPVGSSSCSTCQLGHIADSLHKDCVKCVHGKFPGPFEDLVGVHMCNDCPNGYYGQNGRCFDCPRGFFAADPAGKTDCSQCSKLTTTDDIRATQASECKDCPAGNTLVIDGICTTCPPGKLTVSGNCRLCQAGKYRSYSETICENCASGKFSLAGSPCTKCPDGYYTDSVGSGECFQCTGDVTVSTCEKCSAGRFGSPPNCKDCEPGRWSLAGESNICSQCGIGLYQPEQGKTRCVECIPGKYEDELGSIKCKNCEKGKFQEDPRAGVCRKCFIGTYQAIEGSIACEKCQSGKYTESEGSTDHLQCINCPAGYMEVSGVCEICPERTYQPEQRSTDCETCSEGEISQRGSTSSDDCFSIQGLTSYVFGMKGDSKSPQSESKKCEIRPNLVMLCPGCSCDDDSRNGFWDGPICNECRRGFATTTCLAKCPAYDGTHDSTICNGNGFCWYGKFGNGLCYCGGRSEIDSSGENVVVDVRLCPKGQICPNYGVKEQVRTNYRPLYYIMRYRQFSVFVLQLNKYVPDRGHMWFKRFPPSIAYENTCLACTSSYKQDAMTEVGFWNIDSEDETTEFEIFNQKQQSKTGFHGENCQYECGLCLNGGRCNHAPHPYRYSYTILDTFLPKRDIYIPQTICICSSLVFDSENMCCPNGFQPYIHYGLRNNPKPYTRFSKVPFITSIENIKMAHWIDKDIFLEPDAKYMIPYSEPLDGKIWVANNNKQWSSEDEDFVQVPYRDAGPYNKHIFYGTPREMCRACPGLFGKGVRSGGDVIENEPMAEEKWWDNAMGAAARKCNGIGVCDFYSRKNEFITDFFGDATKYSMYERGKTCNGRPIQTLTRTGRTPETLNAECAQKALESDCKWYAVSESYFGATTDDFIKNADNEVIWFQDKGEAELFGININSKGTVSLINETQRMFTTLNGNLRQLPIPNSDSPFRVHATNSFVCGTYKECDRFIEIPNMHIYKREYGRGDDRLSIQTDDQTDATFDRFDTCFTYTKDKEIQTYGLYVTRDYEQGEDPFLGGLCPKGHFCTTHLGIGYKEACPPGYYQPDQGRTRTVTANKCNELGILESGCQHNLATVSRVDFVDQVCIRCPRNYWSPKGGAICTECPVGKIKKISGIFDTESIPILNIASMTTSGYNPWYYMPNEYGTEATDCAIVPAGIIHVPAINNAMTYERKDFLAVAQCPFGFSSRPGSFVFEGVGQISSILTNSESAVIQAPYIRYDQSWSIEHTDYGQTCQCTQIQDGLQTISLDMLSEDECFQALKKLGITTMITRYGPAGCFLHGSRTDVGFFGKISRYERPVASIKYICRAGANNDELAGEFTRANCFRCPGNSMTGPISTSCTTCFANRMKNYAKLAIQKFAESAMLRMGTKNKNGEDVGPGGCSCGTETCQCSVIEYKPDIQNFFLEYDKDAKYDAAHTFGQYEGLGELDLSDCYLMCQSEGVASPMLITAIGLSRPTPNLCYCATTKDRGGPGAGDNDITWFHVKGSQTFKLNGFTLPLKTEKGREPRSLDRLPSQYVTTNSPPEITSGSSQGCLQSGIAILIEKRLRGTQIPNEIRKTNDPKYPSGCYISQENGDYFINWGVTPNKTPNIRREVGEDPTVQLVTPVTLIGDDDTCRTEVLDFVNNVYPTVSTGSLVSDHSGCHAKFVTGDGSPHCKDNAHILKIEDECVGSIEAPDTYMRTVNAECSTVSRIHIRSENDCRRAAKREFTNLGYHFHVSKKFTTTVNSKCFSGDNDERVITSETQCREYYDSLHGTKTFNISPQYQLVVNGRCPDGTTITTGYQCLQAGKALKGITGFNGYFVDIFQTETPYGCGYSGNNDGYNIYLNTNTESSASNYPSDWGVARGSLCLGNALVSPYGCGYSGNNVHWNPYEAGQSSYPSYWGSSRGAVCKGDAALSPYGCNVGNNNNVHWNPFISSATTHPHDWGTTRGSFCGNERQNLPYGCSKVDFGHTLTVFFNPNVDSTGALPTGAVNICLKEIRPAASGYTATPIVRNGFVPMSISIRGDGCEADPQHTVEKCLEKCIYSRDCRAVSVYTDAIDGVQSGGRGQCCFHKSWHTQETKYRLFSDCKAQTTLGVINTAKECEEAAQKLGKDGEFKVESRTNIPYGCGYSGSNAIFNINENSPATTYSGGGQICHTMFKLNNKVTWFDMSGALQTVPSNIKYLTSVNQKSLDLPASEDVDYGCTEMSARICRDVCNIDRQCRATIIQRAVGKCCFVKQWSAAVDLNRITSTFASEEFYIMKPDWQWSYSPWGEQPLPLCSACQPGKYENSGCTECDTGQYTSTEKEAAGYDCIRCAPGFFNFKKGQSGCTECPIGWSQSIDMDVRNRCVRCVAGLYQDETEQITCKDCQSGFFSGSTAEKCTDCAVGKFSPSSSQGSCKRCATGMYTAELRSIVCKECPKGYKHGSPTQCAECPAGKYQTGKKATTCHDCGIGKYSNIIKRDSNCDGCQGGKYQDQKGKTSCKSCPGGKTCSSTSAGADCAAGTMKPANVWGSCTNCSPGKYSHTGSRTCSWCSTDKYTLGGPGHALCTNCPSTVGSLEVHAAVWGYPYIKTKYVVAPYSGTYYFSVMTTFPVSDNYIKIWNQNGQHLGSTERGYYGRSDTSLYLRAGQQAKVEYRCTGHWFVHICQYFTDYRLYTYNSKPPSGYCGVGSIGLSPSTEWSRIRL